MKYNNKIISAGKKRFIIHLITIFFVIIIAVFLWLWLIPYCKKVVKGLTVNEMVASAALFVTLASLILKFSDKILKMDSIAKRKILLDVKAVNNYANITCKISNCSTKRIIPQNVYLMVEEGIMKNNMASFPYLLRHEKDEFDCVFASICKKGGITRVPEHLLSEEFYNKFREIVRLKHLTSETIMFIDPGEEFSEDTIFKLTPGVYRVTVVWTSVKEDCICCTKEFVIN